MGKKPEVPLLINAFSMSINHAGSIVYANVLRMEAAIQRVAQMEDSLAHVSETLGFSAPSHFTRFFHQHLGATPSQYRKVVDVLAQSHNK